MTTESLTVTLVDAHSVRPLSLRDIVDPSPEYPDEEHWTALLRIAFTEYGEAYEGVLGVLHGIRCCGAQLVKTEKGWTIQPRLSKAKKTWSPDGEGLERETQWQTMQDYQNGERAALLTYRQEVSHCLKMLTDAPSA